MTGFVVTKSSQAPDPPREVVVALVLKSALRLDPLPLAWDGIDSRPELRRNVLEVLDRRDKIKDKAYVQ